MAISSTEALRAHYRPTTVRVLFVGESPPAGKTFFYNCQEWSNLGKYTRISFARRYPDAKIENCREFLDFFRARGCYLDDLCLCPINGRSGAERKQKHQQGIDPLAKRIQEMSGPVLAVVIVMKAIENYVHKALAKTVYASVPRYSLPFPAFGHQQEYVAELGKIVRQLRSKGILLDP